MIFRLVYGLAIRFYYLAILSASIWDQKAKSWINGRKDWRKKLKKTVPSQNVIWFHASSLGEYEMAIPILRIIKSHKPEWNILVSFFSPSGFENFKNDSTVSGIFYLPLDTVYNARQLVHILQPRAVIFVKYEFWPNLLTEILHFKIPLFFVEVVFRHDQWFWKIPRNPVVKILTKSLLVMVQNIQSQQIASNYGLTHNVVCTGDTRFDRALEVSQSKYREKKIEEFCNSYFTIVVGSSWAADEDRYLPLVYKYPDWRWIIVPHDVSPKNINRLTGQLKVPYSLFTDIESLEPEIRVIIVNTVGHLARIYRYGHVALVGGGFGTGLHNILEALAYGIPVFFGPKHHKFWEASEVVRMQIGHIYQTTVELEKRLQVYLNVDQRLDVKKRIEDWFHRYANAGKRIAQLLLNSIP